MAKPVKLADRIVGLRRVKGRDLVPHGLNYRTHPESQRTALRGVLEKVGIASALIARETPEGRLVLLDGHLRREDYGDQLWPVLVLDVTEEEGNLLLASLDPLAELAEHDQELLEQLLGGMSEEDQDLVGFLYEEDAVIEGLVDPDDVPEAPAEPITKVGDLWILGNHRLLCGDSTNGDDVQKLMGGRSAATLFTSPPYLNQRAYETGGVGDWDGLMQGVFSHAAEALADDGQVLVNLGTVHVDGEWLDYWRPWVEWMRSEGWRRFGWYVWDQGFGLPGDWSGRLAPSHEFVFHFNRTAVAAQKWVDKKQENIKPRYAGQSTMRGQDGKLKAFSNPGASAQSTKVPDSVIRETRQVGSDGHPAQFSVAFAEAILRTYPGLTYEPFSGSGTTIIAAEQLGLRCYAMELSPNYCDIAVARWEQFTGRKAQLA